MSIFVNSLTKTVMSHEIINCSSFSGCIVLFKLDFSLVLKSRFEKKVFEVIVSNGSSKLVFDHYQCTIAFTYHLPL